MRYPLFNFRVSPDIREAIDQRATEAGVTASDVVRWAVEQYLSLTKNPDYSEQ
jgi:hypothetical protein